MPIELHVQPANTANRAAAKHFFSACVQGGAAVIDTMNVQGSGARNELEDISATRVFSSHFSAAERWYGNDSTLPHS